MVITNKKENKVQIDVCRKRIDWDCRKETESKKERTRI